VDAQVRDTDLDALERIVSIVAFGDIDAEGPPGAVADVSLRRLLRLSQLANEYLLHVQDHLATRHSASKVGPHCDSMQNRMCTF
jgi:zinc finger protein DZIP1